MHSACVSQVWASTGCWWTSCRCGRRLVRLLAGWWHRRMVHGHTGGIPQAGHLQGNEFHGAPTALPGGRVWEPHPDALGSSR